MTPKFRGGSDDWLDDESKPGSVAKKAPKKAKLLKPEETNATVAEVFPKRARVKFDEDGVERLCHYRRTGVFGREGSGETRERAPVAVGDRVKAERMQGEEGLITGLAARRNQLSRPAPDRNELLLHVIVANLDRLVIVASARDPEFSPGLVDRFLVAASAQRIPCAIAVTKTDLLDPSDSRLPWKTYAELGVDVFELSPTDEAGLSRLLARIEGETVAFCGHSGVGKTSLLSRLLQRDIGAVGDVSEATGKGRHTTTSAVLLGGPGRSAWIDTPGVREFGLVEIASDRLREHFPEFLTVVCAAPGCLHAEEEGCGARSLPRHASYLRILMDLREREAEKEGSP